VTLLCPDCKLDAVVTLTWITVNTRTEVDADDSPPAYRCTHCEWESDSDLDLHRMEARNRVRPREHGGLHAARVRPEARPRRLRVRVHR
jgi:hypothetical protein